MIAADLRYPGAVSEVGRGSGSAGHMEHLWVEPLVHVVDVEQARSVLQTSDSQMGEVLPSGNICP